MNSLSRFSVFVDIIEVHIVAYPQAWLQKNSKGQIIGSYSQVPIPKDGTPTWLPLIPEGQFMLELEDGQSVVDIKREYLEELVANFKGGFPGPAGIPVDQRGDHSRNPEGAYGFFTDLKIEDGGVWGLFEPTPYGIPIIAGGSLPYVSPVFSIGDGPDPVWGKRNIAIDAALCSQPQFNGQPQMVLASAYAPTQKSEEAASAAASHEGVSDMTDAEIQAKIDEAVDAAVASLKATLEQEKADALAAVEQEKADLQATIDDLTAKSTDAAALQTAFDELKAKQDQMEEDARLAAATAEFAAVRKEEKKVLPDATAQVDVLAMSPEAVKIAASAKAFPTAENTGALMSHLAAHGGFEMVTVTEGKPNVVAVSASARPGALPGAVTVDLNPAYSVEAKAFVKTKIAAGVPEHQAFEEFCASRILPS